MIKASKQKKKKLWGKFRSYFSIKGDFIFLFDFMLLFLMYFTLAQGAINIATTGSDSATCNSNSCRTFNYAFTHFHPSSGKEEYKFGQGGFSEISTAIGSLKLFLLLYLLYLLFLFQFFL
jgi:hypothetical protein